MRRRSLLLSALGGYFVAATPHCPSEPLRIGSNGKYDEVDTNKETTCEKWTHGACPNMVSFPDYPCLVNCVADEEGCAAANPQTPAIDKFTDPHLCVSCEITACKRCTFVAAGHAVCNECFPGFVGVGGSEGEFAECELWDHRTVLVIFGVFSGLLGLLFIVILLATVVGMWRLTWTYYFSDRLRNFTRHFTSRSEDTTDNAEALLPEHEQETIKALERNKVAIGQGLRISLMSSIKFSSMLRSSPQTAAFFHRMGLTNSTAPTSQIPEECEEGVAEQPKCEATPTPSESSWKKGSRALMAAYSDGGMTDMGLGLQLFFNTQKFLLIVSFVIWVVTHLQYNPDLNNIVSSLDTCSKATTSNITSVYNQDLLIFEDHGRKMKITCVLLWLYVVLHTWYFHWSQKNFVEKYDKRTNSAEDYTLRLTGLPPHVTSEQELKTLLEKELRMPGKIHGVVICYNVLPVKEQIEEMIEHLIEYDGLLHGWLHDDHSTPREALELQLKKDEAELEHMLKSGKLKGSGQGFVVMKRQEYLACVLGERSGISADLFSKAGGSNGDASSKDAIQTIRISKDDCEPSGLRYFEFATPDAELKRRQFVTIPLRMLVYIAAYALAAQLFYCSMIKPYQDNLVEGAESSNSVKVIGKLVLGFNFVIQTFVMMDVEHAGFTRLATVESTTLVWNTALLLITNVYIILQECFREGIRWELTAPASVVTQEAWWSWERSAFQSVRIEMEVGRNLVAVMTDQITMLYVLGEVANVLLPVVGYFLAIRFLFVYAPEDKKNKTKLGKLLQKVRIPMLDFLGLKKGNSTITTREAEKVQILMPLLLWMEYTYVVIFPAMAFVTFYLLTDQSSTVCGWLLGFSVLFFLWQRYVMLWLYGKATYDSQDSYLTFIRLWGVVISMLPPATVWWTYRLGEIVEWSFAILTMILVYTLSLMLFELGLLLLDWYLGVRDDGVDEFDWGYAQVMEELSMSWWNLNPVYVLKNRLCPNLPGHEVQTDGEKYWPSGQDMEGFFELGKEFKHRPAHDRARREIQRKATSRSLGRTNTSNSNISGMPNGAASGPVSPTHTGAAQVATGTASGPVSPTHTGAAQATSSIPFSSQGSAPPTRTVVTPAPIQTVTVSSRQMVNMGSATAVSSSSRPVQTRPVQTQTGVPQVIRVASQVQPSSAAAAAQPRVVQVTKGPGGSYVAAPPGSFVAAPPQGGSVRVIQQSASPTGVTRSAQYMPRRISGGSLSVGGQSMTPVVPSSSGLVGDVPLGGYAVAAGLPSQGSMTRLAPGTAPAAATSSQASTSRPTLHTQVVQKRV